MYPLLDFPIQSPNFYKRLKESIHLIGNLNHKELIASDLQEVMKLSESFPIPFPIDSGRCKTIKDEVSGERLDKYVKSAYPLIHEYVLLLYLDFISHKRIYGSDVEKEIYANMNLIDLIDRFLKNRAVAFLGRNDDYLLLDGTKGKGNWELIGTANEAEIKMKSYLNYDEIKLSAFLSVSSYSYFINDGKRTNKGVKAKSRNDIQDEGVIIGLIGARVKKPNVMEHQELVYTKSQNTESNGYGITAEPSMKSLMSSFYGKECLSYKELLKNKILGEPGYFNEISKGTYFDNITYSKRIALSIDTLLFEANHRAKEANKFAFIHVVGIGLGVWKCSAHQEEVFMETFARRLEVLSPHLTSTSDVYFSYFSLSNSCGNYRHGTRVPCDAHPKGGVTVYVSKREPHAKLTGDHGAAAADKLLVVSYAWDGNALPGNEFWMGKLSSTGDSACASSTQIAELHNPHINRGVCGRNLRIACKRGVMGIGEYLEELVMKRN